MCPCSADISSVSTGHRTSLTPDATHDQLAAVAFAAVFLLKIAMLYPDAVPLQSLISQVSEVAHVLSAECYAERYALTLKLMLASLRRKTGAASTVPGTPRGGNNLTEAMSLTSANNNDDDVDANIDGGLQSLLGLPSAEESFQASGASEPWPLFSDIGEGFAWPTEFSPSNLPSWIQDNVSLTISAHYLPHRVSPISASQSTDPIPFSCLSNLPTCSCHRAQLISLLFLPFLILKILVLKLGSVLYTCSGRYTQWSNLPCNCDALDLISRRG